jgi:hypothetical protein
MDIHFGVEWFENVHNFGVVGTGIRGVQNSVKYGSTRPWSKTQGRPPSRRTGPHAYVPTRLLENWTARTCTGFLVIVVRVLHYPGLGDPELRGRTRLQP